MNLDDLHATNSKPNANSKFTCSIKKELNNHTVRQTCPMLNCIFEIKRTISLINQKHTHSQKPKWSKPKSTNVTIMRRQEHLNKISNFE